jgi:hypothetical protein
VLKRIADTRWCSRGEAVKALQNNYLNIANCLHAFSEDIDEKADARNEAHSLHKKMSQVEMVILCVFWNRYLHEFNIVNQELQRTSLHLGTGIRLLESLRTLSQSLRDQFNALESDAAEMMPQAKFLPPEQDKRTRRPVRFFEEAVNTGVNLTGREKFRIATFNLIVDHLCQSTKDRIDAYKEIWNRFGFLDEILTTKEATLRKKAQHLQLKYNEDLDTSFEDELIVFQGYLRTFNICICRSTSKSERRVDASRSSVHICASTASTSKTEGQPDASSSCVHICDTTSETEGRCTHICPITSNARTFMKRIHGENLSNAFPNVGIALRLYLTLHVSVAEGERSFSCMGRIKGALRSTMQQERLNALSVASIESDILRRLDVDEIIDEFYTLKERRKR